MSSATLFTLSGHGFYIWASYGMLALAVLLELIFLRRRRQQALHQASQVAKEAPARQAVVQAVVQAAIPAPPARPQP
jgi:heme exporter protein CcmD